MELATFFDMTDWLQPVSGKQLMSKGEFLLEGEDSHNGSSGVSMLWDKPYMACTGLAIA